MIVFLLQLLFLQLDELNEIVSKWRRRSKESKNKNKNQLTDNQIHSTRSSHDKLTKPINLGILSFSQTKQEHKKQQSLEKYFNFNKQQPSQIQMKLINKQLFQSINQSINYIYI